jgi:hypothetical protein
MIPSPNPILITGSFEGAWLTYVRLTIGVGGLISHVRFNGTEILAENPVTNVFTAPLTAVESVVVGESLRLTGKESLMLLTVISPRPDKPVRIRFVFSDNTYHDILDAYALAETDQVFSAAFTDVMTTIGTLINQ